MNDIESNQADSKISQLRLSINEIDESILNLINKRLIIAKEIGDIKKEKGNFVYDKSRENQVMQRLNALNKGPFKRQALHQIFTDIISACREIQTPTKISYLGPEATFTHIAAMELFGHSSTYIPQIGIRDVFIDVSKGKCDYGVVPVENSIEGAINHTLDLFFESDLKICAEKYLNISHAVLSRSSRIDDIEVIYSHPQALAQCRGWIRKNLPNAVLSECNSTAHAAQKASKEEKTAAIANSEAAHIYGLQILETNIEDHSNNITRFLLIGNDESNPTGCDKTSIMFVISHVPGALFKILEPIAESGINMSKMESRPTKHENWSYFFFVDFDGHIADEKIKHTIERMNPYCKYIKLLGSYPRAQA
ncbi:MAG: prephenate dehydratase [Desulfobacteraceae bacterium]|nr:prephenate dehydratase [Desulfobacteraceae bacterium]MBC2756913.1 prephenate dehydratase [Desulfobacteraceae bacterium]